MSRLLRTWIWVAVVACGGTAEPPPARSGTAVSLVATASGADDLVVAQVNGRPVWGSCVAGQMQRGETDRARALDQCIDFELLAQTAEQRGLALDREVGEAMRQALVSRLVAVGFEDKYRTAEDIPRLIDQVVARNRDQMDKPELRGSAFVRVEVAEGAPLEVDQRARALAEQIFAAVEHETGLFPVNLYETATRLAAAAGLAVTTGEFRTAAREAMVAPYAEALFAVPEVGRVSKVARTQWGYDIILMTELLPPRLYTPEDVVAAVFPDARRRYFQVWVNQIVRSLGVRIEVDQEQLAQGERAR